MSALYHHSAMALFCTSFTTSAFLLVYEPLTVHLKGHLEKSQHLEAPIGLFVAEKACPRNTGAGEECVLYPLMVLP